MIVKEKFKWVFLVLIILCMVMLLFTAKTNLDRIKLMKDDPCKACEEIKGYSCVQMGVPKYVGDINLTKMDYA